MIDKYLQECALFYLASKKSKEYDPQLEDLISILDPKDLVVSKYYRAEVGRIDHSELVRSAEKLNIRSFYSEWDINELVEFRIKICRVNVRAPNFFTVSSNTDFDALESTEYAWNAPIVFHPLNDHSRSHVRKGDVLFCNRIGQYPPLRNALMTRGIYAVGIALTEPREFFGDKDGHERWGVVVGFPFPMEKHLQTLNIQMNPVTIDLTPYNGNRNDALQIIENPDQAHELLKMASVENPLVRTLAKLVVSIPADYKLPNTVLSKVFRPASYALEVTLDLSNSIVKALLTKPFLILTGVSGTGKTQSALRLARELALSEGLDQDALLHVEPVGSGWTDQTPLWGFWDSLNGKYQATKALHFLLQAQNSPQFPFFLVLDEMNLSHVERYFSGMLSALESGLTVPLHQQPVDDQQPIPQEVGWPENLFVVGTVNIDETTYMFSPKVLDRASVIEVRADWADVAQGAGLPALQTLEKGSAQAFVDLALDLRDPQGTPADETVWQVVLSDLEKVFQALQEHGLEFGYRTIAEARRYTAVAGMAGVTEAAAIADRIILQRVLPKLNGSRTKLGPLLKALVVVFTAGGHTESGRKIQSMLKALERDQFVSFIQ
jgi:hypothetical protein